MILGEAPIFVIDFSYVFPTSSLLTFIFFFGIFSKLISSIDPLASLVDSYLLNGSGF